MFKLFSNKPCFLSVCSTSSLKTLWEKEKLLVTSNFSFSHSVYYSSGELSAIFIKSEIVVDKIFQFGPVRNIVIWEWVKASPLYKSARKSTCKKKKNIPVLVMRNMCKKTTFCILQLPIF